MSNEHETIRSKALEKYQELNEQLRDFLKNVLQLEKSSSFNDELQSNRTDANGISLLSIKNDLLYQYLMNLVAVMYHRSQPNHSLSSSLVRSLILRLCEIRTSIEKIRPIEHKLQYQMDKLLKANIDQQLTFRANPANFDNNDEDNEIDDEDNQETKTKTDKSQIYRPPKLVPVEYNEDFDDKKGENKSNKRLEYLKRRAYHSDILQDFKTKYSDTPEEIFNTERSRLLRENRAYKEQVAYEEEYLKRLPQTKQQRTQLQRSMMTNTNDIMNHLNDAEVLFNEDFNSSAKKKKGKISRRTKKKMEKKKTKSVKRLKSRK